MGFDGKTLIHPATIGAANEAFSPSLEEVEEARRVVDAAAEAGEAGVCVVDGKVKPPGPGATAVYVATTLQRSVPTRLPPLPPSARARS